MLVIVDCCLLLKLEVHLVAYLPNETSEQAEQIMSVEHLEGKKQKSVPDCC
jgi:hypothetical protein